mmetsp:Transcript_41430/g.66623  ORF Transcript_41430/g.66623 Transcript_41430/m.66623 type:complete len:1048 (-) Transcript_41430:109-3252(-)
MNVVVGIGLVSAGYYWLASDKKSKEAEIRKEAKELKLTTSRLNRNARLQERTRDDLKVKLCETEALERTLWKLVEYIIRDYIEWWYDPISSDPVFLNDIRHVFEHVLSQLVAGIKALEWEGIFQEFIVELRKLMKSYRVTEIALEKRIPGFKDLSLQERQGLILQDIFQNYELHVAVIGSHKAYLRKLSSAILENVLKNSDLNCKPVTALVREILACKVLDPVMWYANSDFINSKIVAACVRAGIEDESEGEEDREEEAAEGQGQEEEEGGGETMTDDAKSATATTAPLSQSSSPKMGTPSNKGDKANVTKTAGGGGGGGDGEDGESRQSPSSTSQGVRGGSAPPTANSTPDMKPRTQNNTPSLPSAASFMSTTPIADDDIDDRAPTTAAGKHAGATPPAASSSSSSHEPPPLLPSMLSAPVRSSVLEQSLQSTMAPSLTASSRSEGGVDDEKEGGRKESIDPEIESRYQRWRAHKIEVLQRGHQSSSKTTTGSRTPPFMREGAKSASFSSKKGRGGETKRRSKSVSRHKSWNTSSSSVQKNNSRNNGEGTKGGIGRGNDNKNRDQNPISSSSTGGVRKSKAMAMESTTTTTVKTAATVEAERGGGGQKVAVEGQTPSQKTATITSISQRRLSAGGDGDSSYRRRGSSFGATTMTTRPRKRSSLLEAAFNALSPRRGTITPQREGRLSLRIVEAIKIEGPKSHIRYKIHCKNGLFKWEVEKRYNEFNELNKTLTKQFVQEGAAKNKWAGKFPRKSLLNAFSNNLDRDFILQRKTQLQEYLDACCRDAAVLSSATFRAFIIPKEPLTTAAASNNEGKKAATMDGKDTKNDKKRKELMGHIYGMIDEIFELSRHGWLRKQVVWTAKQLLGMLYNSTMYRSIETTVTKYTSEQHLKKAIDGLNNLMWPEGKLYYMHADYKDWVPPTPEEQERTQSKAVKLLILAIEDYVPMLGRDYCIHGAAKFLEFLQVDALVQHLAYFLLDKLVANILPHTKAGIEKSHVELANFIKKRQVETKRRAEKMRAQVLARTPVYVYKYIQNMVHSCFGGRC